MIFSPLFLAVVFWLVSPPLTAGENVTTTIGTYMESESNNAEYSGSNMLLAPGLQIGVSKNESGPYINFVFENRDYSYNSNNINRNKGDQYREKFYLGIKTHIGNVSFNPEYELRIETYNRYSIAEKSTFENRFHLKSQFPAGDKAQLFLLLMPTLKIDNTSSRQQYASGSKTYMDYYQETEFGIRINWNRETLSFSLYNEYENEKNYLWDDGSINGGDTYSYYEFQIRASYRHSFKSGINLSPFARVGIVRNKIYQSAGGHRYTENFRRDRYGIVLDYKAPNGIRPYFETYYQRSNMGTGNPTKNMLFWKLGLSYSF